MEGDPYNHTPAWMVPRVVRADQWTPAELEKILANANSLYLVCQHCATQNNALLIASRSSGEAQYVASLSAC